MGRIKGKSDSWVDEGFKASTFDQMRRPGEFREVEAVEEYEFKGLSRKYFEQRNVHENRLLAQKIGVESATTLSRKELIDRLEEKVWGLQQLATGYREIGEADLKKITAEIELDVLEDIKRGEVIIGTEAQGVFFAEENGGVLYDLGTGFNDVIIDTCVVRNLIGEYSLKDGDFVKGRAKYYPQLKVFCLFKIDEINGKATGGARDKHEATSCEPSVPVKFKKTNRLTTALRLVAPVYRGQFGVVCTNGRMNFTEEALSLYDAFEDENQMIFLLGEKQLVIDRVKRDEMDKVYYTRLGKREDAAMMRRIVEYATVQAKEAAKNMVIVVSDMDCLDSDEHDGGVSAKYLASCCGAYDNGGSLTVIAFASSASVLSAYYVMRNKLDFELVMKCSESRITENKIDVAASYCMSPAAKTNQAAARARLRQIALTEGDSGVERALSDGKTYEEIISKLTYQE